MSRLKNFLGLAAVIATLIFLYSLLPLGTALQFGGDEGYELVTGFLMSKGYVLYHQIWNDQPPGLVLLLSWAFKTFGTSILVARLIAASFGVLLFGAFHQLVRQRAGPRAALLSTFFLLASPVIFQLSASVMQEVPAFATALVSARLLFQWRKNRRLGWLLLSGVFMAIALEIKLTAALIVPAMLVEMALASRTGKEALWWKSACLRALQWTAASLVVFAVISATWGQGSLQSSWKAHFAEHTTPVPEAGGPENYPPNTGLLAKHIECVAAAMAGLVFVARQRRWREFAFPIVALATALTVHAIHRPWWNYYYLHLAIPLAWLAGYGADEAITMISRFFARSRYKPSSTETWKGIGLCLLIAAALVRSERRLEGSFKGLQQEPQAQDSLVLAKMREYAGRTHWIYVQDRQEMEKYAFFAQLPMPPEIAEVTLKRYWSGQITTKEIVATCKRNQVEQVLLNPTKADDSWKDFLNNYSIAYQDTNSVLYVAKQIER